MKEGAADVASPQRSRKNSSGKTRPPSCRGRIRLIVGASSTAAAGAVSSTLPGSSAFGAARFLQESAALLFKGLIFSVSSGSGLDFFLFGLHASFSVVQGDLFGGRLCYFPRGGFCFVFAPPSVVLAFALLLAAGIAPSAAARFKQSEALLELGKLRAAHENNRAAKERYKLVCADGRAQSARLFFDARRIVTSDSVVEGRRR